MDDQTALTDRQRRIVEIVRELGFATVEALAREFDVSAQTVRRDIIFLDERELLQRFHGGAGLRETTVRLGYGQKQSVAAEAKTRIGEAVAALIPEGASVFLDVGTTVEAVARSLRLRNSLHVFTSSLPAATLLAGRPGIELFVTGGQVRGLDGSLVGETTTAALARFRLDYAVLGLSGFDDDGWIMDFDLQKVGVKQAALAAARQGIAVADAGKFERSAIVRVAPPERFARLVSDAAPPAHLAALFRTAGLDLTIA